MLSFLNLAIFCVNAGYSQNSPNCNCDYVLDNIYGYPVAKMETCTKINSNSFYYFCNVARIQRDDFDNPNCTIEQLTKDYSYTHFFWEWKIIDCKNDTTACIIIDGRSSPLNTDCFSIDGYNGSDTQGVGDHDNFYIFYTIIMVTIVLVVLSVVLILYLLYRRQHTKVACPNSEQDATIMVSNPINPNKEGM